MKITVLGIGNILLKDEGVGVRVIEHLKKYNLPKEVELIDGGTATASLFPIFTETDHLIVIDAVKGKMSPGTIYQLGLNDLMPTKKASISLHDLGLLEALDMAKKIGKSPRSVVIFGIEPKEIDWGMELTPEINQKLPEIIKLVTEKIEEFLNS
ncbi:MAG TPA: hydrogenase maturation protease [Candidatus Desulfofervidus auxilii]|uniref:Hydrogenase maturation protease n=1 Tax=Desulfofervidus auxilii TaxID=1621989 RepID=A0A7V1I4N6_DESA2|nr:hydrogenase maturation protease [Candidatus Desulfofervidus auxilii]